MLLQITTPDEELLRRVKVLAAAEAAAATALAASAPVKTGPGVPQTATNSKKPISAGKAQGQLTEVVQA
jgi:hypothetical protein